MIHFQQIDKTSFTNIYDIQVESEQTHFVHSDLVNYVKNWESDTQMSCYWVFNNKTAIGFFALDFSTDRHPYVDSSTAFCVLRNFIIDHKFQGCGFASQILQVIDLYLIEHYSNIKRLFLTVNFANPRAIKVYEKAGFHTLPEPYLGGIAGPQHIMEKKIHS